MVWLGSMANLKARYMHVDSLVLEVCGCRLEEHVQLTGPETLLRFDKRMAAATDGLREGLNWGELVNAGGSPAPLLALHTSHPTEQVSLQFLPRFTPLP